MKHTTNCNWIKSNCDYKDTHEYCPHLEHQCDCTKNDDMKANEKDKERLNQIWPENHTENVKYDHNCDYCRSINATLELLQEAREPKFTKTEKHHILSLIQDNEREGNYYGNREQYWKRSDRIKATLKEKK